MGIDPILFSENNIHSFNRYTYGNDNPYKFTDPDGRWAWLLNVASNLAVRAQIVAGRVMQSPVGRFAMQYLSSETGTPAVSAVPRALVAADLGIKNSLKEIKGTISLDKKQLNITVEYIEGKIENFGLDVIPHLKEMATKLGATELRIHGTLADERLQKALTRAGAKITPGSAGKYQDTISIPIPANQIPD